MADNRKYSRLDLDGRVGVKIADINGRARMVRAYLDDISLGGFRMRALEKLEAGHRAVSFKVKTPLAVGSVSGMGRIRHVREVRQGSRAFYEMGVEFESVRRHKISDIIRRKIRGGTKQAVLLREECRDLYRVLKLVPLLILATWLALATTQKISAGLSHAGAYIGAFNKGVLRYLYYAS